MNRIVCYSRHVSIVWVTFYGLVWHKGRGRVPSPEAMMIKSLESRNIMWWRRVSEEIEFIENLAICGFNDFLSSRASSPYRKT